MNYQLHNRSRIVFVWSIALRFFGQTYGLWLFYQYYLLGGDFASTTKLMAIILPFVLFFVTINFIPLEVFKSSINVRIADMLLTISAIILVPWYFSLKGVGFISLEWLALVNFATIVVLHIVWLLGLAMIFIALIRKVPGHEN